MRLTDITLANFKNIGQATLEFSPKINGFIGDNGMGKSNLLDALHTMSFCKSFTGVADSMLIRSGETFAMVKARYERLGADEELSLGLTPGRRKSLRRGGKEYQRLSDHIGLFPLVLAAPGDTELVRGLGEERRRWMDMVIAQGDRRYLEALIRYREALEQRNRLLRDARGGMPDSSLLDAVGMQMEAPARYIHAARGEWTRRLQTLFAEFYADIAGEGAESVGLTFRGSLDESPDGSLAALLERSLRRDAAVGHTTAGPHRDDIDMSLNGMPMKRTASQGQCKTFTTALRLAQYRFLEQSAGMAPLLLLDDILDKLDAGRVERIVALVTGPGFGQIFITDTNRAHLDEIIGRAGGDHRLWRVEHGAFTPLHS